MILLTAGETMDRMFGLDWQLLADSVLTIIAVFALFAAMSYFLFNPARKMLEGRKKKIRDELEDARANYEKAQEMKAEYEQKLAHVQEETQEILSSARKKALAGEEQVLAKAREEAARIMERAQQEAELEKSKAADEVKRQMIVIASAMAGKMVSAAMDAKVQEQLIDETLKEMGESTWLS